MTSASTLFTSSKESRSTLTISSALQQAASAMQSAVLSLSHLGLLLPLAGACAVAVVSRHASGHWTPWAALTAFLCIYSSYLIDHLSEVDAFDGEHASARSKRLANRRTIALGGAAAYAAALGIAAWQSGLHAMLLLLSFPLAVVFYCMPLLPWRKAGQWSFIRLKHIPGFKAVYTAYFWGWLMSFTLVFHQTGTLGEHLAFGGYAFLSLFVGTVLCDFKDIERDRIEGVQTLPILLGAKRTLHLLQGVALAAGLWLALSIWCGWLPLWCLALGGTRLYAAWLLHACGSSRIDLAREGEAWADFEFVLWLPAALIVA